jgi:hypothetical protein
MVKKKSKSALSAKLPGKTPFTRIQNRFTGYSTEDCGCVYCLYYGGKKKGCMTHECCCLEERAQALEQEQKNQIRTEETK